jgi:hypothetical protein
MTLQERRRIKQIQDEVFPKFETDFADYSAGGSATVSVDFESFPDMPALDDLEHQGIEQVSGGIRRICKDELGQAAVREGLTKVEIKNVLDPADKFIGLKDKVLTVHAHWGPDHDYYFETDVEGFLETNL